MNRFKGMSAGAMCQYLEEQKKADELLLQKIKNQDMHSSSSKNNTTKGGKGGSRGNGKGQGTIKPLGGNEGLVLTLSPQQTRVHPPYTDKVTWICPKCLWGNWNLEDPNCFNRKCRAPQPNYAGGAAKESTMTDMTDNRDRGSEEEDQRKKAARLKTLMGPAGSIKGQAILEGAGLSSASLMPPSTATYTTTTCPPPLNECC